MPRPCRTDTVHFLRRLKDAERAVLLSAGQGDLTDGFREVLDVYATLWNAGYRPGISLSNITIPSMADQPAD